MEDNRIAIRYEAGYPAESERGQELITFNIMDISKGGISFKTKEIIENGKVIDLRIFLKKTMFNLQGSGVYSYEISEGGYRTGTKVLHGDRLFEETFEKEIKETLLYKNEKNIKGTEGIDFRQASKEYSCLPHGLGSKELSEQ